MEPVETKIKIFLGDFEVADTKFAGGVTIHLGKQVHVTLWLGDLQHNLEPGDRIPLYTEIPCQSSLTTNPTNTPNAS